MSRLQQRYENFERAYLSFVRIAQAYKRENTEISQMALVQAFEFTFEVSWKLLKSYLEVEGIVSKSPREAIKHSFQQEIIEEGEVWLRAIDIRNETVHTYDDDVRHRASKFISEEFLPQVAKYLYKMKEENEIRTL